MSVPKLKTLLRREIRERLRTLSSAVGLCTFNQVVPSQITLTNK
jgi:hypothetical protein